MLQKNVPDLLSVRRVKTHSIFLPVRDPLPPLTNTPDYSLVIIKVMWGIIGGKIVSNQQGRFSNRLDKIIRTKTMRAIILCWQRGTLDRLIDLLCLNLVIYRWLRAAEE